jgi:hypothetical protein
MIDNKYSFYLTLLRVYHSFIKGMEASDVKESLTRYMMQREMLVKIKEAAAACEISGTDFDDKQQFITFMEEQKTIEEEFNKTNEILLEKFWIRID